MEGEPGCIPPSSSGTGAPTSRPSGSITGLPTRTRLGILGRRRQHPVDEISYGERGMNLKVFYHEQNRTYDDTYGNIYAVENGTLRPLKFISFATPEVWHTLEIYPIPEPVIINPDGEPQHGNRTPTRIDEDPEALIIFAPREIGLAERVVYA
jgi:hypothetical protein